MSAKYKAGSYPSGLDWPGVSVDPLLGYIGQVQDVFGGHKPRNHAESQIRRRIVCAMVAYSHRL